MLTAMTSLCRRPLLLLLLAVPLLASCGATNRLLKAKPIALSQRFDAAPEAIDTRKVLPFHKVWMTPDRQLERTAAAKTKLYIAPVTLDQLRPMKKPLVRQEVQMGSIERNVPGVAWQLRQEFIRAFQLSPRLCSRPRHGDAPACAH
jgi:hypothetical protein